MVNIGFVWYTHLNITSHPLFVFFFLLLLLQVDNDGDFEWLKQLRYYWDTDIDNTIVRMSNSLYIYGYEYLGASARLVITPLTVSILFYCLLPYFIDVALYIVGC